jgi:hypothetical protein
MLPSVAIIKRVSRTALEAAADEFYVGTDRGGSTRATAGQGARRRATGVYKTRIGAPPLNAAMARTAVSNTASKGRNADRIELPSYRTGRHADCAVNPPAVSVDGGVHRSR